MGFFKDLFAPRQPCDLCQLGQTSWPQDRSAAADWKLRGDGLHADLFICVACRRFLLDHGLQGNAMNAVVTMVTAGHCSRPPVQAYLQHPEWRKVWRHMLELVGVAPSDEFQAAQLVKGFEAQMFNVPPDKDQGNASGRSHQTGGGPIQEPPQHTPTPAGSTGPIPLPPAQGIIPDADDDEEDEWDREERLLALQGEYEEIYNRSLLDLPSEQHGHPVYLQHFHVSACIRVVIYDYERSMGIPEEEVDRQFVELEALPFTIRMDVQHPYGLFGYLIWKREPELIDLSVLKSDVREGLEHARDMRLLDKVMEAAARGVPWTRLFDDGELTQA